MKFSEVMAFYDYKMSNIVRALHVNNVKLKYYPRGNLKPTKGHNDERLFIHSRTVRNSTFKKY